MNVGTFRFRLGTFFTIIAVVAPFVMVPLGSLVTERGTIIPHIVLVLLFSIPISAAFGFVFALFYLFRYRQWQYGVEATLCVSVIIWISRSAP